jgi:RNA polymerase sigma-70 factor (ECF subfamily)
MEKLKREPGPVRAPTVTGQDEAAALLAMTSKIGKGDEAAFNRFYEIYFSRLLRYLLVVSGGWEEVVHDALQETMIRILRNMKPFQDPGAFWNWLRRLARTAFIDQVRKARRDAMPLPLAAFERIRDGEATGDPDAELEAHLAACLENLEPAERSLIEGKYVEGQSYEDLARLLDTTPKAVESRLARTRKKLKTMILERLKP